LNRDGRIDIAASTFQEGVRVYWAKEDGQFEDRQSPVDDGSFWRVQAADMNKDGHPDLIATSIDGQGVRLWLNDGSGGWNEDVRYLPEFGVFYGLSIRDLDGDGRPDVTVASRQNGVKVWLRGGKEGTYAKAKLPESLAQAVVVARKRQALENERNGKSPQLEKQLSPPGRTLLYPLDAVNRPGITNVKAQMRDEVSPKAVLTGTGGALQTNGSTRASGSSGSVAQADTPGQDGPNGSTRPPTRSSTEVVPPSSERGPAETENTRVEEAKTFSEEKLQSKIANGAWKPPGTSKPYRIGIGDKLEITMWRGLEADLHKVVVDEKGRIVFAFLENVPAADLTGNQLDIALSKRLQRFIKRPRLDIRVTEFNSQSFTMLGEISKPGRYPVTGPIRILDAIIAGGGPSQSADTRNVKVLRQGKSIPVDLEAIFEGDQRSNVLLENQDQVLLPKLDIRRGAILVVGQLPKQGSFPIRRDLRVLDAVLAAGCCRRVSQGDPLPDIRRARVIRKGKIIPVNLESILLRGDQKQNILLQNGDQVIVPGEARGSLTVVGEISKPGRYSIEGRTQILDVILLAGGQRPAADLTKVRVYREGKPIAVDLAQVLFQGDARQNIVIRDGDQVVVPPLPPERRRKLVSDRRIYVLGEVKSPGVYAFPPRVQNLSLLDALTRAGGFTKFAVGSSSKIIRGDIERPLILAADIDRMLEKGDITQNIPLKDQDIVFVPRSFIGDANDWMDKIRPFLTFFLFPATYRDAYATSTEALRVDIGGEPRTGGGALQTIELSQ
jgi:protein involved in polysaccharide export with SLBB domain